MSEMLGYDEHGHCLWCGGLNLHLVRPELCPQHRGTITGYPAPLMRKPRPFDHEAARRRAADASERESTG